MKKRPFALFLAAILTFSLLAGCAQDAKGPSDQKSASTASDANASATYPEYLNLSSTFPVVKEGHDVTLSFWTTQSETNAADWEENWYMRYLREKSNINLEYTQIMTDSLSEQKNLVLASGELPDIMYAFNFTTTELVTYGQDQGMLLRVNDYITPELTPNMVAAFEKVPKAKALVTLPDGGIYSVPRIDSDLNEGGVDRHFFNTKWLEGIGREMPTTLDELVEVLYLFKSEDPGGVGADKLVPIGSADSYWASIPAYLLNAYGFVRPGKGFSPDLRDGEVVLPAGTEVYREFLALMKRFYDDGIISPDYYTMDVPALNAMIGSGYAGLITEPAVVFMQSGWEDYWAVKPLTSTYNPKQQWGGYNGYILGGFAISAKTEHPEAIMRLADWFFTKQNAVYVRGGPYKDTEDTYGLFETGWTLGEDGVSMWYGDVSSNDFPNTKQFLPAHNESVGVTGNFWLADGMDLKNIRQEWAGAEIRKSGFDLNNADQHYRASVTENLMPYTVTSLPAGFFYFDEAQSVEISDLSTVLINHATAETAKFVTGIRDLGEYDAYLKELETLGLSEYLQYYKDAYTAFQEKLGE